MGAPEGYSFPAQHVQPSCYSFYKSGYIYVFQQIVELLTYWNTSLWIPPDSDAHMSWFLLPTSAYLAEK